MLSWFLPKSCPCDPLAKTWVEERLQWLSDEFDDHAFNGRRLVLPTADFFPDAYDGSEQAVRTMLNRVCDYMDVDPDLVQLQVFRNANQVWLVDSSGHYLPHAAGTYEESEEGFIVRLCSSQIDSPMDLVGTIAHELAHVRLMGEGRMTGEEFDNELLTDLTVVFFGLGIFMANAPREWPSQLSTWPDSSLRKPEYMTRPMLSYALAHLAWFRGEPNPPWARHLHSTARPDFNQAVRFLFQTGKSAFRPPRSKAVDNR